MNTITLYKNPHPYPYYGGITLYKTVVATPRHQNIRSGYIDMSLTTDEVFSFNYLSFKRAGKTVFAWVEGVDEIGGNRRWRVNYSTDSFRTYRNDLDLGTQYVERSPVQTLLEDPLLSSTKEHLDYMTIPYTLSNPTKRYAVVQTRARGSAAGELRSNTPGQPSVNNFYFCEYPVNNWVSSQPLKKLIEYLPTVGETDVITIYSIPYVDLSQLTQTSLIVTPKGESGKEIPGWHFMSQHGPYHSAFINTVEIGFPPEITKTPHNVKLVFPEAGIMSVPDEFLYKENLVLKQSVDLYSGASNYMICLDGGITPTQCTVRGGSLSSIPVLSNPYDTYLSQNQNTLAVSLLTDVATVGIGAYTGEPTSMVMGARGLLNTYTSQQDKKIQTPSNPPAFLGSALVSQYNQQFYCVITNVAFDNETEVRARYGYPQHRLQKLVLPSKGFIQTQNCSVSSNGSVPLWAINEINQLLNGGILFK